MNENDNMIVNIWNSTLLIKPAGQALTETTSVLQAFSNTIKSRENQFTKLLFQTTMNNIFHEAMKVRMLYHWDYRRLFLFFLSKFRVPLTAMALPHISDVGISQDKVKYLESEGRDYCLCHGMVYKDSQGNVQHIPFTLYPSPFPRKLFTAAKEVQKRILTFLVHKVSQDYAFTKNALFRY